MQSFERILEEARQLPPEEQRRLIEKLKEHVSKEEDASPGKRMAALDKLLSLSGKFRSDYSDVSSDKYEHLAEAYADKR
jgi:hypothetical protein